MAKVSWEAALQSAWEKRDPKTLDTQAYRVFSGSREGIDGLVVDRYGDVAIVQWHEGNNLDNPRKVGEWYLEKGIESVYLKDFIVDRSAALADRAMYSPQPIAGKPAPPVFPIVERGLRYLIRPYEGFSTGLFLDQRENRAFLAEQWKSGEVLNCFAYACGFSVACAKAGAKVVSVDVSPKYLSWGKENFAANDIPFDGQKFVSEDMFVYLQREAKRGRRYSMVIVDPPSFGRSDKATFSLKKDFARLLELALGVLSEEGKLFFSCNFSEWDSEALKKMAGKIRPELAFFKTPGLPADFQKEAHPISYFFGKLTRD